MKTLFIDTHASKTFTIGFANKNETEENFLYLKGEDAAIEMIEKIEQLSKNEIEQIIINKGPGSLTGLRIGSSFAQGIALAKNIPILAISLFDLLLEEYPNTDIFFYTGTKKWIHKTEQEEKIIETDFKITKKYWLSNKPELLNLDPAKQQNFEECIKLMYKHQHLATENINLIYPVNIFNSQK